MVLPLPPLGDSSEWYECGFDSTGLAQDFGNKRAHMPAAPESRDKPCESAVGTPKLRFLYLWQGVATTPLRSTHHGQKKKNCKHHHPADSAPGSIAVGRLKSATPWPTSTQAAHGKLATAGQFESRRTRLAFDEDASISLGALKLKLTTSVLQLRQHFLQAVQHRCLEEAGPALP